MTEDVQDGTEQTEQIETRQEPEVSLSEHEAQFSPGEKKPPVIPELEAKPAEAEAEAAEHPSAQQKRDRETGQFTEGRRRRARSQQAGAEDVPRIKELTRQVRERDEELARLRNGNGQPVAGPGVAPSASGGNGNGRPAAAAQAQPGERYVLPAPPFDPEPLVSDPKFAGDRDRYVVEAARWSARQEVRQNEFDRAVAQHQQTMKDAEDKENRDFASRIESAKTKYEDFEEIALEAPTPIVKDSVVDIFIRRHKNGAEVLYYLQHPTHHQETGELLKMPELEQLEFLTLLSQRLSPNGSGLTGSTTSVPSSKTIVLPHPPPKVVRTEAQPARGGIPTDRELSLSEHEHYFQPTKRR